MKLSFLGLGLGLNTVGQGLGLHNGGPIKSLIIDRRILGLQEVAVRLLKKINSLTCKLGMVHIFIVT